MRDHTFKTYISHGLEHYVETSPQGKIISKRSVRFPDSLLAFTDINLLQLSSRLSGISTAVGLVTPGNAHETTKEISEQYDYLAKDLAFFEISRFQWKEQIRKARQAQGLMTGAALRDEGFAALGNQLPPVQQQIKTLIPYVLDMDKSKETPMDRMVAYYQAVGSNTLNAYHFSACTTSFELVDKDTFAEVLYPNTIFDIIDFHVRECVRRELKFRVCKNCGKYFAVTGHAGVEYCDRVINKKGQTCKDIGAFRVWEKSRSGDEVFKVYRREYKKRFAWIKAGRIEPDTFYSWSEKAREKKTDCEAGKISFEEFADWLSNS